MNKININFSIFYCNKYPNTIHLTKKNLRLLEIKTKNGKP